MNAVTEHPLVTSYLAEFDAASAHLDAARRLELREEIAGHLREAIPVALSSAGAAAVIADFGSPAEILGQEAAPEPSRTAPPSGRVRRVVVLVIAALLAVALVVVAWFVFFATPAPSSVVTSTPLGVDRVQAGTGYYEYLAEIDAMPQPLPEGAEYPDGVQQGLDSGAVATGTPEEGTMEAGAGRVVAQFTWLCAWEGEYLGAVEADDAERQVAAEAMLTEWPSFTYVESGGSWAHAVLDPMILGDASGVEADFPESCRQAGITDLDAVSSGASE